MACGMLNLTRAEARLGHRSPGHPLVNFAVGLEWECANCCSTKNPMGFASRFLEHSTNSARAEQKLTVHVLQNTAGVWVSLKTLSKKKSQAKGL